MIRIKCLRTRAVRVPMAHPHQTASGTVGESPLVLIDVVTDQSVLGHGIVFTYTAAALKPTAELVQNLAPLVEGEDLARSQLSRNLPDAFGSWEHRGWLEWPLPASICAVGRSGTGAQRVGASGVYGD